MEQPVEVLFFNTIKNSFSQYRNQITLGPNSKVRLVEQIYDLSNSFSFVNNFTKVNCGANGSIEYNKVQNNTKNSSLIDSMSIFQKNDSTCEVNTLIFGGGFIRNNLNPVKIT